ncbi:hypothetical protein HanXRQr2_Chr08g0347471 [Helianthus annuus]|uniref:Uncharacterized protein n=1 Tax=Helianthus annuus TaxID=4232 RepID=A0A251U7Z9_HELAN|nr:hypothetical protein HanXRQr2_Chr08g0347471 [Helianthus annuus]KAJ0902328.1 hypothetical protein HanPSC8_Chr08g0335701 [Helianthus annuus]
MLDLASLFSHILVDVSSVKSFMLPLVPRRLKVLGSHEHVLSCLFSFFNFIMFSFDL